MWEYPRIFFGIINPTKHCYGPIGTNLDYYPNGTCVLGNNPHPKFYSPPPSHIGPPRAWAWHFLKIRKIVWPKIGFLILMVSKKLNMFKLKISSTQYATLSSKQCRHKMDLILFVRYHDISHRSSVFGSANKLILE